MDIEISYNGNSHHIEVENPYNMDNVGIAEEMYIFLKDKGIAENNINDLSIPELLPKMVRGVAGCESGCPANAHSLVRSGFRQYKLEYIEGGILKAVCHADKGLIEIKVFPDF